jgi:hypothetical protein
LRHAAFTFVRGTGFVAAIACPASLTATLAAEPKPDFAIKTRSIEASVFLDAKIKADPALAAEGDDDGQQ